MAVRSGELAPSAKAKALTTYKKRPFQPVSNAKVRKRDPSKSRRMEQKAINEKNLKAEKTLHKDFLLTLECEHGLQTLGCDQRVTQMGNKRQGGL